MQIEPIALLSDNYAWLLTQAGSDACAIVDPSEAAPVRALIEERGLTLKWILATHHHWDHVGGIEDLVKGGDVTVYCSRYDFDEGRVPCATVALGEGDSFELFGEVVSCMDVPGHTLGAIAYYVPTSAAVFTGDTLFTAGCGRLFEGTPAQMHASLTKLAQLPQETLVYCGHEYTEKNLSFAASVEGGNATIVERLDSVKRQRAQGLPTVPATLELERATNPFLRSGEADLVAAFDNKSAVDVFTALRSLRDNY